MSDLIFRDEHERELWANAIISAIAQNNLASLSVADSVVLAFRKRNTPPIIEHTPQPFVWDDDEKTPSILPDVAAVESVEKLNDPVMGWRDARPEDAGKGMKCRVRNSESGEWHDWDARLIGYRHGLTFSWEISSAPGGIFPQFAFAQVLAPVEAKAEADDGWLPFEACPDNIVVNLQYKNCLDWFGQRFQGNAHCYAILQGADDQFEKIYPTHFRMIGGRE